MPSLPPPSIPDLFADDWSCEEMVSMRKNRRLAQAIYGRVKNENPDT